MSYCLNLFVYGDLPINCDGQALYKAISIIMVNLNLVIETVIYFFVAVKIGCICFTNGKSKLLKVDDYLRKKLVNRP